MYLEKENIFFVEEKKSGEGKARKYLEKENIFSLWGKRKAEKEKGEIIWTRKINGDANQPGEPAFSKKTEGRDLQYSQQRRGTAKTKVKQKYDSLSDVPESRV